jgi:hypothetical protein
MTNQRRTDCHCGEIDWRLPRVAMVRDIADALAAERGGTASTG